MPAPTNTTAGTATDLGALPATATQQVDFGGVTYEVFYKVTAPAGAVALGLWCFGDLTIYKPATRVYSDIGLTTLVASAVGSSANKRVQFICTPGTVYYIKITPNAGNPTPANLSIDALVSPNNAVAIGDIFINDDTDGYPATILDGTQDYTVKKFITPFPSGEGGDILETGVILVNDLTDGTIHLFDRNFTEITAPAFAHVIDTGIRSCRGTNNFWVGSDESPPVAASVSSIGTVGITHTLTGAAGLNSLAASNDETILYLSTNNNGAAIEKWDLVNDALLGNLAAGIASYFISDILVLSDDTILAVYSNSGTKHIQVKHYDTDGTVLNTYDFGTTNFVSGLPPRLAYALDDTSFWILRHPSGADDGKSFFENILLTDGSLITRRISAEFEAGTYEGAATATPFAKFGNSFSCPFFLITSLSRENYSGLYEMIVTGDGEFNSDTPLPHVTGFGKTNDTLVQVNSDGSTTETDIAIPNPFVIIGPVVDK